MYKWINVHIYKCLNPKYTHGQLYNVQMYNVQKYNVQKDNVLNMSAVLGVILTPWKNTSGAHFLSVLTIFKTALVSIIFILELSVLDKSCLELNFQAKGIISRVPCTPVFLRSRTSGFQY